MLKYHGTPLTPNDVFDEVMPTRNCLIPFPRPQNIKRAKEKCEKIIIDNGAFTIWNKGGVIDWGKFYNFVEKHINDIEMFFIPDVIDGTEEENDALIVQYLMRYIGDHERKCVPIWHLNESLERLERLVDTFDYIAIGSAGEYRKIGTPKWFKKMDAAMRVICCEDGYPKVKVHMLRCLNPDIFIHFPFYSGDSTTLAQNHQRDGWQTIVNRIEKYDSPDRYQFKHFHDQRALF